MTKIGIITANKGRVEVLRIFVAGVKRLREDSHIDIPCVCVGDVDGRAICNEYGIEHIEYPNKPLTGKFNRACEELKGRVDAVCIMGTDNLLSTETFTRIVEEAEKGTDLIGYDNLFFFALDGQYKGNLYHFTHTTVLGVARTISAKVLDKLNWRPWGRDMDRSIDTCMLDTVRPYVETRALLSGGMIVDLKSKHNLNAIDFWAEGKLPRVDREKLFSSIGEEERYLINKYMEENQ